MKKKSYISALSIAGFDGSGGAGIQADIKTFSALGCYATSVLTALPIQNTQGVQKIYPISIEAVQDQLRAILDDIFPKAIKIGMVHTPELVELIVNTLGEYPKVPIIFDPVMVATSGHRLIEEDTVDIIIKKLIPIADLITPNMDEASILANKKVVTLEDINRVMPTIKDLGCKALLLKGGHLKTKKITSLLMDENGKTHSFESNKIITQNMHGSGCTLSSAITAFIAKGKALLDSVVMGQDYVYNAIINGASVTTGNGNGPLNHFYNPQKLIINEMV